MIQQYFKLTILKFYTCVQKWIASHWVMKNRTKKPDIKDLRNLIPNLMFCDWHIILRGKMIPEELEKALEECKQKVRSFAHLFFSLPRFSLCDLLTGPLSTGSGGHSWDDRPGGIWPPAASGQHLWEALCVDARGRLLWSVLSHVPHIQASCVRNREVSPL